MKLNLVLKDLRNEISPVIQIIFKKHLQQASSQRIGQQQE